MLFLRYSFPGCLIQVIFHSLKLDRISSPSEQPCLCRQDKIMSTLERKLGEDYRKWEREDFCWRDCSGQVVGKVNNPLTGRRRGRRAESEMSFSFSGLKPEESVEGQTGWEKHWIPRRDCSALSMGTGLSQTHLAWVMEEIGSEGSYRSLESGVTAIPVEHRPWRPTDSPEHVEPQWPHGAFYLHYCKRKILYSILSGKEDGRGQWKAKALNLAVIEYIEF